MTISWNSLRVHYGQICALNEVSGKSRVGLTLILGSNGSGKTTLLKTLAGYIEVKMGEVLIDGHSVTRLGPQKRFLRGVRYTSQNSIAVPDITPEAYLAMMGDRGALDTMWPLVRKEVREDWNNTRFIHSLPVATRRIVDLAIVFSSRPSIALLDEPIADLGVRGMADAIRLIKHFWDKCHLVIVEHRPDFIRWAMESDAYSYFLHNGQVAMGGDLRELVSNELVQNIYGKIN
uniref:Branched-chain amino acid transport system ATP-binding protein n=1 Tax=Candidatus Kentrum sp. LFY TaxID=2126342 RepID=A0A450WDI9_9GAMM|nr:MAG: branched-chain amino acid transport system ATP-binding protein [Candidatus Kentron sp. LFY]